MADAAQQLAQYRAQLAQVERVLAADPSHAASLQLRAKLTEVVALYTQLLAADDDAGGGGGGGGGGGSEAAASSAPAASSASSSSPSSSSSSAAAAAAAAAASSGWPYPIGSVCEFRAPEGQFYPVRVVGGADPGDTPVVRFVGFGREKAVPAADLRPVPPLDPAFLQPVTVQVGLECEAKYFEDGLWYAARVQEVADQSVKVLFTLYGNSEEVPRCYLRTPRMDGSAAAAATGTKRSADASSSSSSSTTKGPVTKRPKLLPIPEKLRAKEGDTDKEREAKRRRMRAIKSKNRFAKMEIDSMDKQASWKSFQKKATKKLRKKGVGESQFSTAVGVSIGVRRR